MLLLERETELALAAACLRRATAGHGSLLLVEGPLGTGRSSFLEALPEQAPGGRITVLRAQASSSERRLAFGVVDQLVESAACAAATAESGRARRPCDYAHREPAGDRVSLSDVLDAVPGEGTVLVLVDDLHWCDAESLAELSKGLAGRHDRRVVFAMSLPSGVVPAAGSVLRGLVDAADRRVRLGPLGPEAVRRSVEAALGGSADAEFVAAVRVRSAGSPLLLRSLLDEAYSRGLRPRARGAELARTLRSDVLCQYLTAFLRSQPDALRRTVHALCVLGGDADRRVAALLAGLDAAGYAEAVGALRRWGLGRPGDEEYGTLLWDALADGVPADELTDMRNRAAVLLHRTGHSVEAAAGQLMSVHTLRAPGAAGILRAAADRALARGAPRDAARYLRQALLDGSCTGPLRARVLTDLAVAERQFATVAALRHVVEALPLFESALDRAAAAVQLGPLLYQPSESGIAALTGDLAAQLRTRGGEDAAAAELTMRLEARHYALSAQDPAVVPAALRRLGELGARPPVRTVGERELLAALIHIAFVTNKASAERVADLGASLMALEPPDPRHAHTPLPLAVNALAAAENTAETVRWLDAVDRRVGQNADAETAVLRAERAMVALSHGRIAEARRTVVPTGAAEEAQARASALCTAVHAIVTLRSDEPELAEGLLTGNLCHHRDQYHAALLHMARGLLAARRRHDRIALHHFRTAGERLERIGWSNPAVLPWSSRAALVHLRLGEQDRALAAARLEVERARAWGAPSAQGRALVALGRVTPGRRGTNLLAEAVSVLERSTNADELCRALYAYGSREGVDGRRAGRALERARELSVLCGADRMTRLIREQIGRRPAVSGQAPELTPSEARVARLAAAGLHNADIARELQVSKRMIERYLTNAYRKLDISGRHALPPDVGAR
ncbi:LuxR family transcriptional regulator [Streptomyces sp. NPDC085944]|uniref:LuxR family transcriptional regulator n=1 Tax=Streptomyces sp. NPDC085944 TaxID=3154962 RepID=UPI00342AC134